MKKVYQLEEAAQKALRELSDEFQREFPNGSRVTWTSRKYPQTGTVEYNAGGGDWPEMRVRNDASGRMVWVRLWMKPQRL